ncbi:ABC transporter permease [Paenibacillus sp. FSL K6-1318]|uniref:ABC transporter permease n=1 Tax=Paenibacillus sp. FSL K6-1318 TaxID=2975291 RepID=UPI0030EC179B
MADTEIQHIKLQRQHFRSVRRRQALRQILSNASAVWGIGLTLLVLFVSLVGPWIITYQPLEVDIVRRLTAPGAQHWFGTDNFGRDILSRVVHGTRNSAQIGIVVALIASVIGLVVGLYSSMYKWLDQILMRVMDALYAFPAILLAIAIMAALGPSMQNLTICLIIVFIPAVARIVRSVAIVTREQTYIEAMEVLGASNTRIIWRHLAPNALPALVVQASFVFAESIIVEAALSFLGAGIPAPTPSLGNQLSEAKMFIFNSWWMTLFPGFALILTVLAMNLLGDGLRDMLDPHTAAAVKKPKKNKFGFRAWMPTRKGGV